jgi:hypothetical protein
MAGDANGPASPVSFSAPDRAEEASAALQRPVGGVCSLPLYE